MKLTSLLRVLAVQVIAPLLAAKALAQRDDLSQQYCSSQNTADNYAGVSNIYQSNGACFQQCLQDYAFAIVQYQQCWCSNYIPAEQLGTGSCDTPCPGYPDESCGNNNSGLFGYVPLRLQPSGTAGVASSTQASSTSSTPTPTPTPSSTSTTPVSTSTSTSYSSSTSDPPRSSSTAVVPSSSSTTRAASTTSTSAQVLTSTSSQTYTTPTTSSQEPASTTAAAQTITTSTSSTTSAAPTTTPSTTTSSTPTSAPAPATTSTTPKSLSFTPSPVVSTRVVTLSGAVTTETVTSTPAVFPAAAPAFTENERKSISGGAIAGIVIGVLLLLLLLILAIFFLLRRRQRRDSISETDAATTGAVPGRRSPRRNVSVLSKVGLLARNNTNSRNNQDMSENLYDDNTPATGQNSVRHSMLFNHGGSEGIAPVSPLAAGGYASSGHSYGQESSRRYSRPLVYDQRLNPSALWANAEANGSRVSIQDHADYSRSVGGRLGVVNPDTRSSFASSRG
ncbi:hypothetical protein LTR95_006413 [Oleoguttula sp. CCFEE 5521]